MNKKERVLIINEFYEGGGSELQSHREKKYFEENGYKIWLLTFDDRYPYRKNFCDSECWINIPLHYGKVKKFLGWVINDRDLKMKLNGILEEIKPTFIHVNNVFSAPYTVYNLVERYPALQTIRDYSAICPKGTCIKFDNSLCKGYKFSSCIKCTKKIEHKSIIF